MGELSKAELRALKLIAGHPHQDGVIDRYGNVVCAGEHKSIAPPTWLRLVSRNYVTGGGFPRLVLTPEGRTALGEGDG